ncbi:hypothetical protein QP922_07980 [Corynebacterium sp. MSK218]|uniref:hypothetical protein n=1 Tax=unclassified Corynebacterium TaxID=2624378 RepID=UPI0008A39B97|nr:MULTISPECIES: hypothetical protein [unclassified Corynebacterium]MDK8763758.1 hypothetical protein [Corynebacterium sp. MSK218]OFR64579.1 hypothetical protein HMPREF2875_11505 [Corynebacterium sp. HMSC078H07]
MDADRLAELANTFASRATKLLDDCLPGQTVITGEAFNSELKRFSFQLSKPLQAQTSNAKPALLEASYAMCENSSGEYLAVASSSFKICYRQSKKRPPIVRFEYERDALNKPVSHFHFHSDSVALGLLLASTGQKDKAFQQQDIHFPMGGHRFRVCLEDVVELVIREFGVAALDGWEQRVLMGREEFRNSQKKAIIRSNPQLAIDVLRELGHTIPDEAGNSPKANLAEW